MINFSLSTVINTFIISSLLICLLTFLVHICVSSRRLNLYTITFLCAIVMVRLFLPFEFPFTYSVYIMNLWNGLHSFLSNNYLHFNGFRTDYMHLLLILWGIISSGKLLYSFYSWRKTIRAIKALPEATDPNALQALKSCSAGFKEPVPVKLYTNPLISSPFITGIRHPAIVIPDIQLTEEEWCFIFTHELSHFYKSHLTGGLLLELLSDLYFWNPFLLLLKRQFYRLLEFSADEKTISSLNELQQIEYSECLVRLAREQAKDSCTYAHSISFGSSGFGHRVRRILNKNTGQKTIWFNGGLLILSAVLFLLSYTIILEPAHEPHDGSFTMDASDTYYLSNGDGTYDVIHDNEYLLTTDWIFDDQIPIKEE